MHKPEHFRSRFEHYLITRINLGLYAEAQTCISGALIDPEAWMRHRMKLFRDVCCASVGAQVEQRFSWVLLLDEATPSRQARAIVAAAERVGRVIPLSMPVGGWRARTSVVISELSRGATHVITTRFDNDDALSRHAIGRIQSCYAGQRKQFVVFPRGLRWSAGRAFAVRHPWDVNAFKSLIEVNDGELATVYSHVCGSGGWAEVFSLETEPTWLQVIHDRNLDNAPDEWDEPVPPAALAEFRVRLPQ